MATGSTVTFPENAWGPDGEFPYPIAALCSYFSDWVPITKEQAYEAGANPFVLYIAEKKYAEQAVLKYAEEHPEMDITICKLSFHS